MPPLGARPRWIRFAPLLVGCLASAVYLGALLNGFTFDDPLIVAENPLVAGEGGLRAIFTSHYWASEERHGNLYRPLTMASYWLNYRLAGGRPWSYHLVNLLLHGAMTGLVYLVFRRLVNAPQAGAGGGMPPGEARGETVAAIGALLFATHPIHAEAVVSVVGRAELMAALFVLAAWRLRERAWACAALFACGLLSKENAVVLPGLLFLEDLLRRRVRTSWRTYLALGATLAGFLALRAAVLSPAGGPVEGPFTGTPAMHRIWTAVGVLGRYLWLSICPVRLSADYSYNQIPIVTTPLDPACLTGALAIALCGIAAWIFFRRGPLVSAGIVIFFMALAPVSNLFFGIGVTMAERLLYLPSVGLCLASAAAIEWVTRAARSVLPRPRLAGACAAGLVVAVVTLFTARSAWRTTDWFDQITLFEATVKTSPDSALAWLNLGSTCQALGRMNEAEAAYRRTIQIAPDRPGPHFNLATLLEKVGRDGEAIDLYREALRIDPDDLRALNNLGRALVRAGKAADAIPILERAVVLSPAAPAPKVNLAAAHLEKGDALLAERIVREVLASHPDDEAAQRVLRAIERRPSGVGPSPR